jgi:hypothetical protein
MNNNNKKYFLKETGEELEFGDVIELSCVKELEDGRATVEKEIKFSPETKEALIELGVVELAEPLIDFLDDEDEDDEFDLNALIKTLSDYEKKMQSFEEKLNMLEQAANRAKNASPKKK